MLDARRMQILRSVVTSGSVSAAAANLGYTPSAISQQVAVLEKEAGTALLEKHGRGLRPTPAGSYLAEQAARMTALLNDTEAELADIRAGRTGRLRLRFFHTASTGLVPRAVAKFRADHPDVHLDLEMFEHGVLDALAEGEADVAVIVLGRQTPAREGVRIVPLAEDPYRVVLPRGHRLAGAEAVDLAWLAEEPWIDSNPSTTDTCAESLQDAYASAGFTPRTVMRVDGSYTAQGFVAAELGVSLVPALGMEMTHPDVVVRPLRKPAAVRPLHIAVRETVADRPATEALLRTLRETARAALEAGQGW
ncbi:LysR family transcriptional regulator [Salinifilum ghardaiensis]